MNNFSNVKKNFGFGCMRLPMKNDEVDMPAFIEMVDTFMEEGFNYFDTAHGYLNGKSETAIKEALTSRYHRDSYILTDKLSTNFFKTQEEIRPLFQKQLECCGVDYFDFYLMHSQTQGIYEKFKKCKAYETATELLKEGKIKHLGLSFHDKAELLEEILTEYPQIEVVQIQFNYADYEDEAVQGRKVYEVCRKFGKPIIVMEPVKGGSLVNLPADAQKVFDALNGGSNAEYAIRFAAGFEGVFMVLSGMGNMDMIRDNLGFMKDFKPLDTKEMQAVEEVTRIITSKNIINCTACKYCISECPKNIPIPDLFACMNGKKIFNNWNSSYYYSVHTSNGGKAGDCIECGKCEAMCPQHLEIRKLLKDVSKEFDKKED